MAALIIFLIMTAVLVFLYLLAIMPRIVHKPDLKPLSGFYYAHRGLHDNEGEAPENSLAAFRKAAEAGFGIELDLQLSKDGEVVVFHDVTLERACQVPGLVSDYTYEELCRHRLFGSSEAVPRFQDVLKLVDGKVPLIVELKVPWQDISVCPATDRLLSEYRGFYCIESFNPLALIWYKKNRKEVIRGQLADRFSAGKGTRGLLYRLLENLMFNWVTRPDFVAYNHQHAGMLSRRLCRRLFGNTAVAWTIQSEAELERAKSDFDLFIFDGFIPSAHKRQDNQTLLKF